MKFIMIDLPSVREMGRIKNEITDRFKVDSKKKYFY